MSQVPAVTRTGLIEPHGGELVDRTGDRPDDVEQLEVVPLTSRELSDLDMLASGALSPLEGFMGEDYERVVEEMRLASGLPWALPVCLAVDKAPEGDRVALADESRRLVAVLEVDETYEYDKEREAEQCFRTADDAHPGVARLYAQKPSTSPAESRSSSGPSLPSRSSRAIRRRPARSSRSAAGSASSVSRRATRSTGRTST